MGAKINVNKKVAFLRQNWPKNRKVLPGTNVKCKQNFEKAKMIPEYFKGILQDLQEAQIQFSDAELVASDGQSILSNTLVLASLSPSLKSLLKNHWTGSEDEKIKILIPDLDFDLLKAFFQDIIFTSREDLELESLVWQDVISLLGIGNRSS